MRKINLETRGIILSRGIIIPFLCRYGRVDFRTERKMDRSSTRSPVTWQAVASWYIMCNVLKDWEEEKKVKTLFCQTKVLVSIPLFILQMHLCLIYDQTRYFILKKYKVLGIIIKFLIYFQGKSFVLLA